MGIRLSKRNHIQWGRGITLRWDKMLCTKELFKTQQIVTFNHYFPLLQLKDKLVQGAKHQGTTRKA